MEEGGNTCVSLSYFVISILQFREIRKGWTYIGEEPP